jgi:hypothetical protein
MAARRRRRAAARRKTRYWSHTVKTVYTYPPKGLFTKDARTIARSLASKRMAKRRKKSRS